MKKTSIIALLAALMLMVASVGFAAAETEVVLRRGYGAPHGERAVGRAVVLTAGDTIVAAHLDEFQYMAPSDELTPVPNSDKGFGAGAKEGVVLISKKVNDATYSKNMADKAKATMLLSEGYAAIEAYVVGKTIAEVEETIKASEPGKPVDAVSSSTLVDTVGYLQLIVDVAKSDAMVSVGKVNDTANVTLKAAYGAPHGERSFGDAVVALEDGKVVAANLDEFQYFAGEGLPNSDKGFGGNYAKPEAPLASKKVNDESYSKNMADKAKATMLLSEGYAAIEAYAQGKTGQEIKDYAATQEAGKPVDAITSSTLVDTVGYLNLLADAALAQ